MTVITTTTLRNNMADSIRSITEQKGYMLLSNNRKITSALVDIDLFEDMLSLMDKDFLDSVSKARQEYENGNVLSHEELFGEL